MAQSRDTELILRIDGKECAYPRLSSDDKRILYQSNQSGKWQLYLLDLETKQSRLLSDGKGADNFPDWSSDNRWIAFVSNRDGNEEIYLVRADGTGLKRITDHPARDIHPYFSPDGKYLLFNSTRANGSLDIFRYTISTGKVERLTDTGDDETCARYAPDMREMVYLRNSAASDDVYTLDFTNFLSTNLTNTPEVQDGWPAYGPDGKLIYFSSMKEGAYSIYRCKRDGSGLEKLTNAADGEEDARVSVAHSGRFFIYNKRIGETIEIRKCRVE